MVLAVLGALFVALGVGLLWVPVGVVVAGVELVAAGYVVAYVRRVDEAA